MQVRTFDERDIPAAAALFARVAPANRWASRAECERYFRAVLFDHPWKDLQLSSWVAEEGERIVGFYAVLPHPMLFRGRTLRVAVACQIVVEREPRFGLVALQLLQACLSGPQDLTLADGASERSRRMWLGLGGLAPPLYNLQWTRLLRPARFTLGLLGQRGAVAAAAAFAARPLAAIADGLAARLSWNRFYQEPDGLVDEELDAAAILEHLPAVAGAHALQPIYDARSLEWILAEAARKQALGQWRARSVHNNGRLVGWYAYYLRPGGVSEVLQIAACDGAFDSVLAHLLAEAWRHGVAAVRGRLDPRHIDDFSARHCWFRREGASVLVHSRHADVLDAIVRGEAFLTRLDGEWFLRFQDGEGPA